MSEEKKNAPMTSDELDGIAGGTYEQVSGSEGDDTIRYYGSSPGEDHDGAIIHAGDGNDTVEAGGYVDNIVYGEGGDDSITGGYGQDFLDGGSGDDSLSGGQLGDYLNGGEGNDLLDGGSGDDTLVGGSGDDTLTGGTGSDTFIFDPGSGDDIITDFDPDNDSFNFMGVNDADDFEVQVDDNGNTIISFGDTTITLEGVALTHDQVAELAGFDIAVTPPSRQRHCR